MWYIKSLSAEENIKNVIFENINSDKYKVFLFWSRVNGKYRANSDYDIWIYWEKALEYKNYLKLKRELEKLPYLIDLIDFKTVDEDFKSLALNNIKRLQKQIILFEKANNSLVEAMKKKEFSDLEKDWVIQRFEYTIEIWWKTLRKVLDYEMLDFSPSPREIIKESFRLWYIYSLELWDEFIDIRNQMSHIYSNYYSEENFNFIKLNYKEIERLVFFLKEKFI